MPATKFRDELTEPTAREFDALYAWLRNMFNISVNEDGSLQASALSRAYDPTASSTLPITGIRPTSGLPPLASVRDEEYWWRNGPWTFDDPSSANQHLVGLRPPNSPAGTYHNYAPAGIDKAVIIELEPAGNITLTGIKAPSPTRKRMLFLRNRHATYSVTLTHGSTSSIRPNRFSLPSSTSVVLGPGQNAWLYYDLGRAAWTIAVTDHASGGLGVLLAPLDVTRIVKTSDETITDAATVQNDSELTFAMTSGVRYRIFMHLFMWGNGSPGAAGFQFGVAMPAYARFILSYMANLAGATRVHDTVIAVPGSGVIWGWGTANVDDAMWMDIIVEPTADGTFALTWSNVPAPPPRTTTVYRGSYLEYFTY